MTGRCSGGNYSGFGDVFRSDIVENNPVQGQGYWQCPGPPGPGPVENIYYQQHQQANMMANRQRWKRDFLNPILVGLL